MSTHSVAGDAASARRAATDTVGLAQSARLAWIGSIVLVALFVVLALNSYIEKWLWMQQLDYVAIFWTILSVQCALAVATFVIVFAFLWLTLHQAIRGSAPSTLGSRVKAAPASGDDSGAPEAIELVPLILKGAVVLVSGGVALLFAIAMFAQWNNVLRFWSVAPFGISDPLYGVDVGFYVFHLLVCLMPQRGLLLLSLLALAALLTNYVITGAVSLALRTVPALGTRAVTHILALFALLFATLGWGFSLDHFQLLYSAVGIVYGAGYTAANVTRWALWGMAFPSAVACVACAISSYRQSLRWLAYRAAAYAALWAMAIYLVPGLFQLFIVQPRERAMETPNLTNDIDSTRSAFQLDRIAEASYTTLGVYRGAFPDVFKPLDASSPDSKAHLRYPEDIFAVRANHYKTFHMTDPQGFYNREDLWAAPIATYAGEMQRLQPYHILAKPPGGTQLKYMLMTRFTPHRWDNMISWMAARSDFPEYGKSLFYERPKDKLIYGPNHIAATINQNAKISQQLTLWTQNGSRVIRSQQIVTPIETFFLCVVPLYLTAAATDFPQLKRVTAIAGDKVVMESTLDEAIRSLFGSNRLGTAGAAAQTAAGVALPADIHTAAGLTQARTQLDAQDASGHGDCTRSAPLCRS